MTGDTQLQVVNFQSGLNKNTTPYTAENYWVDGDKVRSRNGKMEKIGGWVSETVSQALDSAVTTFTGTPRDIHAWSDLSSQKYFATGSEQKVELFYGSQIYDITPYREELTLNNAISTTSGNSIVTIADTNHGLTAGDRVFVDSQASAVDGVTLSGEYVVVTVVNANSYTIDSGITASGTTANAGGNLDINYLLENGQVSNGNVTGYGGGTWDTPGSAATTTINLNNAITTNGTSTILITDVAHGLSVGDEIQVVSQASAVDGIDLSSANFTGDFEVLTTPTADTYTIKAINNVTLVEYTASGSTANAGGALVLIYGSEGWDRPRSSEGGAFLRQWSFDNWGEDLVACVRNGKIYHWDATNGVGVRLQTLTNAPTENLFVLVAQPSRFLVAFGSQTEVGSVFDPLVVRWASQETLTTWTSSTTNTAGEFRLPLGNYIVTAIQTKNEIIVLTDNTAYSMRYVGGTEVFRFEILATNISVASQHCGTDIDGIVYWMGVTGYYRYDGAVRSIPCSLEEFIFDHDLGGKLSFEQKEKTFCASNKEFNEIIWFYQTVGGSEIDRYVMHNYLENTWYDGTMNRTVWLDRGVFEKPYALTETGVLYIHEEGKDADGSPLRAFVKSGDIDLGDGNEIMFIDKFIPDFTLSENRNADLYLFLKKYPNSTAVTKGPYSFTSTTERISPRARARHAAIQYEVSTVGADFEVGTPRFGLQPDGGR